MCHLKCCISLVIRPLNGLVVPSWQSVHSGSIYNFAQPGGFYLYCRQSGQPVLFTVCSVAAVVLLRAGVNGLCYISFSFDIYGHVPQAEEEGSTSPQTRASEQWVMPLGCSHVAWKRFVEQWSKLYMSNGKPQWAMGIFMGSASLCHVGFWPQSAWLKMDVHLHAQLQ